VCATWSFYALVRLTLSTVLLLLAAFGRGFNLCGRLHRDLDEPERLIRLDNPLGERDIGPISLPWFDMKPGDIVIMAEDWATMYVGDGMLLNSNEVDGQVTLTPIESVGEPLGVARPNYK
jgi:hypothetical protein